MRLYRSRSLHGASVGLLVTLMLACPVCAQTSRGTVSGTVLDSSGLVLFGSSIELTNIDTNSVRTAATNSAGIYRFDAVDLGRYTIKISMQCFKGLPLLSLPSNSHCSKCFFSSRVISCRRSSSPNCSSNCRRIRFGNTRQICPDLSFD